MRITLLQTLVESCAYTKSIARQAFKILITVGTIIAPGVVTLIFLILNAYAIHCILVNIDMFTLALLSSWARLDVAAMSEKFLELHHRCSYFLSECREL